MAGVVLATATAACAALVGIDDRYAAPLAADGGGPERLGDEERDEARDEDGSSADVPPETDAPLDGAPDLRAADDGRDEEGGGDAAGDARSPDDGTIDAAAMPDSADSAPPADSPDSADSPGSPGSPDAADSSDAPTALPPPLAALTDLRLWLTADRGLHCSSGRVTTWADQSGNQDDAVLEHSQLGPQCLPLPSPHTVQGVALPYFSAPVDANAPNVLDESLDVDLQFLANSDYTIFVVERRWADYPDGDSLRQAFVVGTTLPLSFELNTQGCSEPASNIVVSLGYVYYTGAPRLALDQSCNTLLSNEPVDRVPIPSPAPLSLDTGRFDQTRGHDVWRNGALVASNTDQHVVTDASGGAIGRAFVQTVATGHDERFQGDIAEVLVFAAALDDADRAAVDAYLQGHWGLLF